MPAAMSSTWDRQIPSSGNGISGIFPARNWFSSSAIEEVSPGP